MLLKALCFSYDTNHVLYNLTDAKLYIVPEDVIKNPLLLCALHIFTGATMYIVPEDVMKDPIMLCAFFKENAITRMIMTPSHLEAVLDSVPLDIDLAFKTVRFVSFH